MKIRLTRIACWIPKATHGCTMVVRTRLVPCKVKVKAAVRGRIRHGSLMAYCTLDPLEALHTERYAAPQLAKE
jgi:hypothetical protein